MRLFFCFLLGLLVGACSTAATPLPSTTSPGYGHDRAERLERQTVALVAERSSGLLGAYCSGVWVSEKTILTAAHCMQTLEVGDVVAYSTKPDVFERDGVTPKDEPLARPAALVALDQDHDLALVRAVNPPPHIIAVTATRPLLQGDYVQTMGHSIGLWWSYSTGDVAALRVVAIREEPALWIQSTVPISPGNSGGGLFDSEGALVGLAEGSFTRGEMLNLFVHQQYIDMLLKSQATL